MIKQKYCYRIFRHMFLLRAASNRRAPPSFGGSVRRLAEEDGIKVPCCPYCHTQNDVKNRIHDNPMAEKLSKIAGQLAWEKHAVAQGMTEAGAREAFRKRYNSSLL